MLPQLSGGLLLLLDLRQRLNLGIRRDGLCPGDGGARDGATAREDPAMPPAGGGVPTATTTLLSEPGLRVSAIQFR